MPPTKKMVPCIVTLARILLECMRTHAAITKEVKHLPIVVGSCVPYWIFRRWYHDEQSKKQKGEKWILSSITTEMMLQTCLLTVLGIFDRITLQSHGSGCTAPKPSCKHSHLRTFPTSNPSEMYTEPECSKLWKTLLGASKLQRLEFIIASSNRPRSASKCKQLDQDIFQNAPLPTDDKTSTRKLVKSHTRLKESWIIENMRFADVDQKIWAVSRQSEEIFFIASCGSSWDDAIRKPSDMDVVRAMASSGIDFLWVIYSFIRDGRIFLELLSSYCGKR